MATFLFANNAATTLAGPLSNTATTCNVAAGAGTLFPQPGVGQFFAMTFLDAATRTVREIVYVTSVTGDTLTITRAQENTAAGTWSTGDIAANLVTAGTLGAFAQSANLASSFYQGTDNGSDVNNVVVPVTTPVNNGPSAGQIFVVTKGPQANTGAVTLRIPSAGTQSSLVYADGSALIAGDWPGNAGMIVRFTGGLYQVLSRLTGPKDNALLHVGTATSGTATALTTVLSPLPTTFGVGLRMHVPITTTNGAAPTLDFGAGAPKPLVRDDNGVALVGNEMPGAAGYYADIIYDGTSARVLNPSLVQALQNFVIIVDQKAYGTPGGTFTSGAWRTRDLNTIAADINGLTSGGSPIIGLANNAITLQPGKYIWESSCPAESVDTHRARLQNTTDGTTVAYGSCENGTAPISMTPDQVDTKSLIVAAFTLTAAKTFQLQHICGTTSTSGTSGGNYGFGCPSSYVIGAVGAGPELYSIVKLTKVA